MSLFGAIGGALLGTIGDMYSANKAAKAQQKAANDAIAEQRRQFDTTQANMQPWLTAGSNALTRQQDVLDGNYTGFMQSPDYLAALDAGTKQLDYGATARGNLWGGGADADRIQFGQNLATQNLNNYWSKLSGMSSAGQQTANQLSAFGQQTANNIGNAMTGAGNARASAYQQQGNAFNDLVNSGISLYGYKNGWWGNNG